MWGLSYKKIGQIKYILNMFKENGKGFDSYRNLTSFKWLHFNVFIYPSVFNVSISYCTKDLVLAIMCFLECTDCFHSSIFADLHKTLELKGKHQFFSSTDYGEKSKSSRQLLRHSQVRPKQKAGWLASENRVDESLSI